MSDPGTAQELLILNSVAYFPKKYLPSGDSTSLADWAEDLAKHPDEVKAIADSTPGAMNADEVNRVLNTISTNRNIYDKVQVHNVTLTSANPADPNDQNATVVNATFSSGGQPIIVYKGTGGPTEWRDNGEGGYANVTDTKAQQDALDYYNRMMADFPGQKAIVTGHSKGGNKAQYVGLLGDSVDSVYSFDGQGFNAAFYLKYADQVKANAGKIHGISNQYDFVNILFTAVPGSEQQYTNNPALNGSVKDSFPRWHSPATMFSAAGAGFFLDLSDAKGSPSAVMAGADDFITFMQGHMRKDDFAYLCYTAMSQFMGDKAGAYGTPVPKPDGFDERFKSLLKNYLDVKGVDPQDVLLWSPALGALAGAALGQPVDGMFAGAGLGIWLAYELASTPSAGYQSVPRDFSAGVKQTLLALVAEVDAEAWWDVTKWDVWYRIDKNVFGGVDFSADEGQRREYYRKMIDMNGTSRAQIEKIFSDVYEADRTFASQMQSWTADAQAAAKSLDKIADKFNG